MEKYDYNCSDSYLKKMPGSPAQVKRQITHMMMMMISLLMTIKKGQN